MSMIEKAARAASEAMGEGWREPPFSLLYTDALNNRARYVARAVIEALMEPTPEMVEAGKLSRFNLAAQAHDIWKAMLTAALNEGEGT